MVNAVNEVSQAAIGRALNLSPAAITKLKGQGMPVTSVAAAQAWREQRQNVAARKPLPDAPVSVPAPAAPPRIAPPASFVPPLDLPAFPGEDHDSARTRLRIAEANLAEMRESEERGDLIRIDAVKATLATVFATTRDALLQIPARMAPLLAADADPASVHNMLHAEIHQALHHLAGSAEQIGKPESTLE